MNLRDFISEVLEQMEEGITESTFEICIAPSEGDIDILVVPEGQHSGKLKFTVKRK